MNKRISWIDICKGFAIFFVVLGHVVASYQNSGLMLKSALFNIISKFVYAFHMPLFFYLSGLLSSKKEKRNIAVDICSYAIPYIIFSILLWAFHFSANKIFPGSVNNVYSLMDLILIPLYPLSFMWFVYALMGIVLLESLLKNSKKRLIISLIIGLILNFVIRILRPFPWWETRFNELGIIDVLQYYFWYVLGKYMACYFNSKKLLTIISKHGFLTFGFLALLIFIVLLYIKVNVNMSAVFLILYDAVLALLGILMMCLISMGIKKCEFLECFGRNTMPVYLLHGYFVSVMRILIKRFDLPLLSGIVPIVLCSIAGLFIPYFCYLILKKVSIFDFCFYPKKYILKKEKYEFR